MCIFVFRMHLTINSNNFLNFSGKKHLPPNCCCQVALSLQLYRPIHVAARTFSTLRNKIHFNQLLDCVWNVMAYVQKPDFVFRRNGRVHLNRRGRQFSLLLTIEVCASAVVVVVMLDTPRSDVVWRELATHSIRQFPLHFPSLRHRVPSHFNSTLPLAVTLWITTLCLHSELICSARVSQSKPITSLNIIKWSVIVIKAEFPPRDVGT